MAEQKTTPVTIFGEEQQIANMKVNVTFIGDGVVVVMVAQLESLHGDDEEGDSVWAGNIFRPVATMADVNDMISELGDTFQLWKSAVSASI